MATFRIGSDGTAIYGNVSVQWRKPTPLSQEVLRRTLSAGDVPASVRALSNASVPLSRDCESLLASLLRRHHDMELVLISASMLGVGTLKASLEALEAAFQTASNLRNYTVAIEVAAALFRRGHRSHFRHLIRDLAMEKTRLDPEELSRVVGLSAVRGLPLKGWPPIVLRQIASHPTGRFVALRVLLARGSAEGKRMALEALRGDDAERERAIIAIGQASSAFARKTLGAVLAVETSLSLRLLCAECLKGGVDPSTRADLILSASLDVSPLVRLNATRQIQWMPRKARRQIARKWLEYETDEIVKERLLPWLSRQSLPE